MNIDHKPEYNIYHTVTQPVDKTNQGLKQDIISFEIKCQITKQDREIPGAHCTLWTHGMETLSPLLTLSKRNPPVTGGFPGIPLIKGL